jgi:hypothetical protein
VAGQREFPGYPQLSKLQTGNGQNGILDIGYWLPAIGYHLSSVSGKPQTTNKKTTNP